MENFVNELKLKISELNELVNNFEIENLKTKNIAVDKEYILTHLTDEDKEIIRKNYNVDQIFEELDIFEVAGELARDVDDIFDEDTIKDYVLNNTYCLFFEDEDDLIDYVQNNFDLEDLITWK